jgi:hypothetical protein
MAETVPRRSAAADFAALQQLYGLARYFVVELAESHLTRRLSGRILRRIERLASSPT